MMEDNLYQKLLKISKEGEKLFDVQNYVGAIQKYNEAFELIPNPKTDFEAGSWLMIAIGDAYFLLGNYEKSLSHFKHGEIYPKGLNSFSWLRIGQCFVELGTTDSAREYLIKAYAMEGIEIFEGEDSKYIEMIKDLI